MSHLDLAAHTQLKVRKGHQQVVDRKKALRESLLKLEAAERKADIGKQRRPVDEQVEEQGRLKLLKQTADIDDQAIQKKYNDADADADDGDDDSGGWSDDDDSKDGDDLDASSSDEDGDGSDDDDSDSEDDEAALQAELAKIRAEREAKKQREAEAAAAAEESQLEEAALIGNPLLASGEASGKLKRRWNDDVVFRNQAKGEPSVKKRFINDTVRNDFHKRFLNKFIR